MDFGHDVNDFGLAEVVREFALIQNAMLCIMALCMMLLAGTESPVGYLAVLPAAVFVWRQAIAQKISVGESRLLTVAAGFASGLLLML